MKLKKGSVILIKMFMWRKNKNGQTLIENELISAFITGDFDAEKIESYKRLLNEKDIESGFMLITPAYSYIRQENRR